MKILISPFAKPMRDGKENPKNYPYWKEILANLTGHDIIQVGGPGEKQICNDFRPGLSLDDAAELIKSVDLVLSVDSFIQHYAWFYGVPCVVFWSKSDPVIFGHKENVNLLKNRSYLRANQFAIWEEETFDADAFVSPEIAIEAINKCLERISSGNWNTAAY